MRPNTWLNQRASNVTSQKGEDGIIAAIFEIIQGDLWCVEFGANDGHTHSNTYSLIQQGWHSIQIEAKPDKFELLKDEHQDNDRVTCLNQIVELSGKNSLQNILKRTPIPQDFDLLCIDIDGCDYWIWHGLEWYRPKVICIEFNPSIPHWIPFAQPKDMKINQGCSLRALVNFGKSVGYELVASTDWNGFFVAAEYFPLFEIANNSIWELNQNYQYWTAIFQLYNGQIVTWGCDELLWHGVKVDMGVANQLIQVLPPEQRIFSDGLKALRQP